MSRPSIAAIPLDWHAEPLRNIAAGAMAAVVSLPLSIGLGVLAFAPFGPEYATIGMMAGLHAAAFLSLIALLAGARGVAIYAPRGLVVFSIAAVASTTLAGAQWLPKDNPTMVSSVFFLMLAMVGIFQLLFAVARLPRLVKYLPAPVMAGFQNAAAIALILSQAPAALGSGGSGSAAGWRVVIEHAQLPPALLCALTLGLIFYGRRLAPKLPPLLTALIGGTLIYHVGAVLGFSSALGGTLGHVSAHIPDGSELAGIMAATQLPGFLNALPDLVLGAFTIAVVASIDVLMSAKVVENMSGQRGNSTRALVAIGMSNSIAPLLGGIAGSISLAPTTTGYLAGGRTSLSLMTHGVAFVLIIALLAPMLGSIPRVVVGALVIYAGIQLFDRWTFRLILRTIRRHSIKWRLILVDLVIILLVAGFAISGYMAGAVIIGVLISALVFTVRMTQGMVRRIRYADQIQSRRSRTAQEAGLLREHGRRIMAVELEGPVFFASAEQLDNHVDRAIREQVKYIIMDVSRVTEVDSTGSQILMHTVKRARSAGALVCIAGYGRYAQVLSTFADHGVSVTIRKEDFFPDLDRALEHCEEILLRAIRGEDVAHGDIALEQLSILGGLDQAGRERLVSFMRRCEYAPGTRVFGEGEVGDAMYLIMRGSASVRIQLPDGDRRLITFSAGTVFGEMALLDRQTRSATVTVDEQMTCYVLDRASFDDMRSRCPDIALALLANLASELSLRLRLTNRSERESS